MTIVVAGEALFDLVLDADGSVRAHPGGGPFNAARTIGRLGAPVTFLGGLSTDAPGRRLAAMLDQDGVDHPDELQTHAPTTLAVAELGDDRGATYRFYTEGTAAATEIPAASLPSAVDAWLIGTLGLVIEPLASSIERLVGRAPVLLDANVRPSAIADEAAYRARLTRLLEHTDVLKASDDDLAWLAPGADPVAAARELGAPTTLVTRGAHGATVVTADQAIEIPAPQVDVVDTIGAGDAFAGAFLARRHEGADTTEAATFAARVAAITCTRAGADPPTRAEL